MTVDNAYRRGTLLGLTIAEIFILLIFLLLLAFLGVASLQEDEAERRERAEQALKEKDAELRDTETVLAEWRPVMDEFKTPEEILTLHRRAAELQLQIDRYEERLTSTEERHSEAQRRLEQELAQEVNQREQTEQTLKKKEAEAQRTAQELTEEAKERQRLETAVAEWRPVMDEFTTPEEILALHRRAAELQQQINRYEDHLPETEERQLDLQALLEDSREKNRALREENRRVGKANEQLQRDIDDTSQQMSALQEELDELAEQVATEAQAANEARTALDVLQKKGKNPPCWYTTVRSEAAKTREKPHYTFDVAVYDDAIVVGRRDPPPGRAEDDNGLPYADEARSLGLERIAYGDRLTNAQLMRQMRRLHELGKTGKVRTYPCIFWVRVWDKTSPDAKARWKDAHDNVLESLFGTYSVRDDTWPHGR